MPAIVSEPNAPLISHPLVCKLFVWGRQRPRRPVPWSLVWVHDLRIPSKLTEYNFLDNAVSLEGAKLLVSYLEEFAKSA